MDFALKSAISDVAWYCAWTQPKHEHIAARNIKSRLGLEVFNPRLRVERATRRGVVRLIEPLFPGYIFVRCALAERVDDVRYTNGVSTLVHFGNRIPAVPDEVIGELAECFEAELPIDVEDRLIPGSQVTVAEGPLLGSQGVIVRVLPARQRVQVLLDFLGQATLTEVDRKTLSPADRSMAELLPSLAMRQLSLAGAA